MQVDVRFAADFQRAFSYDGAEEADDVVLGLLDTFHLPALRISARTFSFGVEDQTLDSSQNAYKGRLVAFDKLRGLLLPDAPVTFTGQQVLNVLLGLVALGCGAHLVALHRFRCRRLSQLGEHS